MNYFLKPGRLKSKIGFQTLEERAQNGDAQSQYQLALMYDLGIGVSKNTVLSFKYYKQSAKQNYPKAQYNLAIAYALAKGVEKNISSAKYWVKRARDNGYSNHDSF